MVKTTSLSWEQRTAAWLLVAAVLALALFLLANVLTPFILGLVLAYLLDPLANRLQNLGFSRLGSTVVILLGFLIVLALAALFIVPLISGQLANFIQHVPEYATRLREAATTQLGPLAQRLGGEKVFGDLQSTISDLLSQATSIASGFLKSLWSGGAAVVNVIELLVVTPVVAFYLLLDWDRMVASIDSLIPRAQLFTVRRLARDIDRVIAGFIRGQALVCLLLGTLYAITLSLLGLNFAILVGSIAGLLTFIPYFGSAVGFILAVGIAIAQFWPNWTWIVVTGVTFMAGQTLEGNVITPRIVGDSTGLHPVWLIFALLAFGALFGFLGLLLAVPMAAAIGVLTRYALDRYVESPLYLGRPVERVAVREERVD